MPHTTELLHSQRVGEIVRFLEHTSYSTESVQWLLDWIEVPVRLSQAEFSYAGEPGRQLMMGLVTWALLDYMRYAQASLVGVRALRRSEWNEGLNIWVNLFAANRDRVFSFARLLHRRAALLRMPVAYKRRKGGRTKVVIAQVGRVEVWHLDHS